LVNQNLMKNRAFHRTAGVLAMIAFALVTRANDYCVSTTTGVDGPGRGSQALPWKTINYALDHISGTLANPHRVLVAQGVYVENVVCDPYESIYGGHNPSTWVRDPNAYPTTINGNNLDACVVLGESSTVDGFTLSNGKRDYGGGVSCSGVSAAISNCRITFNTANINGSAIYINGGAVQVISNSITFNTRSALYLTSAGSLISNDNVVSDTISGSGIYVYQGTISLLRDRILRSAEHAIGEGALGLSLTASACTFGDNLYSAINQYSGSASFTDCIFVRNNTQGAGTGNLAGAIDTNASLLLRRCVFGQNTARFYNMRACLLTRGQVEIEDSVFTGNQSPSLWACEFIQWGGITLKNNFFVGNGVIEFTPYSGQLQVTAVNNSVLYNSGGYTGNYIRAGEIAMINDLLWGNGDDLNFTGSGGVPMVTQQAITYCNIEDGDLNGVNGNISVNPDFVGQVAAGTINALTYDGQRCRSVITDNSANFSPNALARTFLWVSTNAFYVQTNTAKQITVYGDLTKVASVGNAYTVQDYHLMGGSLCIDAGTQTSTLDHDFEGDPRPSNGGLSFQVDIGADEYVPPPFSLSLNRTNAEVILAVSGPVGPSVTVQYATNLANPTYWMPLTNFVMPFSPYSVRDPIATGVPRRFYRALR
jgi:hypothetical protein